MRKRKVLSFFIIVLIIVLIILVPKYIKLSEKYNWKQSIATQNFKSTLVLATDGFATDFSSSDENGKDYMYNEGMSNLYASAMLFEYTTYERSNKNFQIALINLYKLMEDNTHKKTIMLKSKVIYDNLCKLTQNPEDKQATDNIINLTEEIRKTK